LVQHFSGRLIKFDPSIIGKKGDGVALQPSMDEKVLLKNLGYATQRYESSISQMNSLKKEYDEKFMKIDQQTQLNLKLVKVPLQYNLCFNPLNSSPFPYLYKIMCRMFWSH